MDQSLPSILVKSTYQTESVPLSLVVWRISLLVSSPSLTKADEFEDPFCAHDCLSYADHINYIRLLAT